MDDKKKIKAVEKTIQCYKDRLVRKVNRSGLWENFGQEEVNVLRDEYLDHQYLNDGVWNKIREFDNWCQNYTGVVKW